MADPIHKKYPDIMNGISDLFDTVSMDYVLRTGVADTYTREEQHGTKVDLSTDSEGQRAIKGMIARAQTRIEESPGLQALLNKPTWTQLDRMQWESSISDIARDLIAEEPRFGKYRLDDKGEKPMDTPLTDITSATNFHCEPMAILTGVLVQNMENKNLPETSPEDSYKRRQSYYLGGGMGNRAPHNTGDKPIDYWKKANAGSLLHSYLISPMTGNVIEGTQGRPDGWTAGAASTYQVTPKGYTFEHYIAGFPISTRGDLDYTYGYSGDEQAKALAQSRLDAVNRGDYEFLRTHRADQASLGSQYDFLNARNFLRANRIDNTYYKLEGADAVVYATRTASEKAPGEGRSYEQLIADSNQPDFSMTATELKRANEGNIALWWAVNNPNELRLIDGKGNERLRAQPWQDEQLANYLMSQGVEDVWLFKPLPKGESFESFTRAMFDQLPAAKKTYKDKEGKETPITFADYLALSREHIRDEETFHGNENAPGTMVPVLMNPGRAVAELQNRRGRNHGTYYAEDLAVGSLTSVGIYDKPGTKSDVIQFVAEGSFDGSYQVSVSPYQPIKLGTTLTPGATPPKPAAPPNKGTEVTGP